MSFSGRFLMRSTRVLYLLTCACVYSFRRYSTGPPTNCSALNRASPNTCAWAAIQINGRQWSNASVGLDATGRGLVLTTVALVSGGVGERMTAANLTGSAYGYGPIPLLSVETVVGGLPVLAWNTTSELRQN